MGHWTFIALCCALNHCKQTSAFVIICFFLGSKLICDSQTVFSGFTTQQKKEVKQPNETITLLLMPLRKFRKVFHFQTVLLRDSFVFFLSFCLSFFSYQKYQQQSRIFFCLFTVLLSLQLILHLNSQLQIGVSLLIASETKKCRKVGGFELMQEIKHGKWQFLKSKFIN